jgi:hypothetical protein
MDNLNIRRKAWSVQKQNGLNETKPKLTYIIHIVNDSAMTRLKKWQIINTNITITSTAKWMLTKPSHCAIQSKTLKWYKAKISLKSITPDIFTYISPFFFIFYKRQVTAFYLTTGWPLTLAVLNAGHCLVFFPFHCVTILQYFPFCDFFYIQTYCQNIYLYICP